MTEEDTFEALRRTPFRKVISEWNAAPKNARDFPDFLTKHGWTQDEWFHAVWKLQHD